jgi:hypothetical protein
VYGDSEDAKIYRLKVLDLHIVRVADPRDRDGGQGEGGDKQANRAPVDASSRSTGGG